MTTKRRFSHILDDILGRTAGVDTLSLGDLVETVGPKGHAFLTLFLALPFSQPIPLPGISTIGGLAIAMAGFCMARQSPLWLPDRLARGKFSAKSIRQICLFLRRWQERIKRRMHLREHAIFLRPSTSRWIGLAIAIMGALLSLPLPIPTTNAMPALAVLFLSFASLEEDLRVLLLACFLVAVNFVIFSALVLLPVFGVRWLNG